MPMPHRLPAGHETPPHTHTPAAHESLADPPQLMQVPPSGPQAARVGGDEQNGPVTALKPQQPAAQLVALHTQAPAMHCRPAAQAAFAPQRHAPVEQLSAFVVSHATHEAPAVPHAVTVSVLQLAPVQQPFGQLAALQTQAPLEQRWPTPHELPLPHAHWPAAVQVSVAFGSQVPQAAPAGAHAVAERAVQTLPEQQPVGQLAALHTHAPFEHSWPAAHAAPVPHAHAPELLQRSLRAVSQAAHAAPPAPQVGNAGVVHAAPWQHPPGQLAGVQAQVPPSQC